MSVTPPIVAGVILVVVALFGLWEAQQARVDQRQWLGRALLAICFLCMGSSSLLMGSGSALSGALSVAGAVMAALGALRLRSERRL